MFGTVGLSTFFLLPLLAGAGMVVMGAGTVLAPGVLLLVPFVLARA